ncbi:MAG: long-chain fatty acid--CoA ligase [Pseudomonadota bacterium]|nr:long-chain fatty acid--CoA ligase [Pseudomonadota bacterium]
MSPTILHYFLDKKQKLSANVALTFKVGTQWSSWTWGEFFHETEKLAAALNSLGINKSDKVAIISNTRPEWAVADLAILGLGAITIPIYPSNTAEEIEYILNDSETKLVILEDAAQYEKWNSIKAKCPIVANVLLISDLIKNTKAQGEYQTWPAIMKLGKERLNTTPDFYVQACQCRTLAEDATIPYTSGTTGVPKGVLLTHLQIASEVQDVFRELGMTSDDLTLTFLPYSHVLGRVEYWGSIYVGYAMAFAENIDKIRDNLKEIRPTVLVAVPRIFEKIYNGVISQSEISATKKTIFRWALRIGTEVSRLKRKNQTIPISLFAQYMVAQKLVFSKLQNGLGGRIRFAISGGAPLSAQIAEFFHAAGILVLEGYGLTETTAAITLNRPHDFDFGTVGKPLADVKIKFANDGEILIKSEKVMKEYYKNSTATNEVMLDGWFATGDIGDLTERGFLRITDRKKDLIKTAGGKYIAPQKLENLLKLNKYISNVLVHGDQRKYIVTLVTLNADEVKRFASQNSISYSSFKELSKNQNVQKVIRDAIAEVNSQLANYETIKNFEILADDFTIESGELTPSLKVKRKLCDKKYKSILDGLYGVES